MTHASHNQWLHRFAVLTALATLGLIALGGLVTSHEAGMSVPDWPNSYGYNMFLFPPSKWIGGILYEHTHRLWASMVGVLVVALTRWLGGRAARRPLAIVGALEILVGVGIYFLAPHWSARAATTGFLTGIGGVVLLGAVVWFRNEPSKYPLPQLGWAAFWLVQFQGLLGGLRVVLFKDQIGIFHATLAQLFFTLTCAIALLTSKWWTERRAPSRQVPGNRTEAVFGVPMSRIFLCTTVLILLQLILGATMRHQHAGLSIRDFPLAYGKLWPATDAASVIQYNAHRMEITDYNPITAFQIELQMVHRIIAVLILCAVSFCAWKVRSSGFSRTAIRRLVFAWLGLIFCQVTLGAATVLSEKAADIATLHVVVGALSLATGTMISIIAFRFPRRSAGILPAEAISKSASTPDLKGPMEIGPSGEMPATR